MPELAVWEILSELVLRSEAAMLPPEVSEDVSGGSRVGVIPYDMQRIIFDEIAAPADFSGAVDETPTTSTKTTTASPSPGRDAESRRPSSQMAVPVSADVVHSLATEVSSWQRSGDGRAAAAGADRPPQTTAKAPPAAADGDDDDGERQAASRLQDTKALLTAITATGSSPSSSSDGGKMNMLYVPLSALGSLWQAVSSLRMGGNRRKEEQRRVRTYSSAADSIAREDSAFANFAGSEGGSSMASAFAAASAIMASASSPASSTKNQSPRPPDTKRVISGRERVSSRDRRSAPATAPEETKDGAARAPERDEPAAEARVPPKPRSPTEEPERRRPGEDTGGGWRLFPWPNWLWRRERPTPQREDPETLADRGLRALEALLASRHFASSRAAGLLSEQAFDALIDRVQQLTFRAAAEAAVATRTRKQALAFVEEVGLSPLLSALDTSATTGRRPPAGTTEGAARGRRSPDETSRATNAGLAAAALANVATILPFKKAEILRHPSLVDDLLRILEAPMADSIFDIEAKKSAAALIGTLAMDAPQEERAVLYANRRLVRVLESIAGGTRVGHPEDVARQSRRALACLGVHHWRPRVRGQRGLRILALDGGGTRALMAFEILKHITRSTGCQIHELFDIICGTSTGAIIAGSLGLRKRTVDEVEGLYRELIGKIFAKKLSSGPKMLLTRAYYDSELFESILRQEAGNMRMIDSTQQHDVNYVFFVSSVMDRRPHQLHLFRNYCHAPGHESRYMGMADAALWQGMRASSAAPTFFTEVYLNGHIHADGALVANNPAGIAAHEARRLFPHVPIELLVSVGTGVVEGLTPHQAQMRRQQAPATGVEAGDVAGLEAASAGVSAFDSRTASAAADGELLAQGVPAPPPPPALNKMGWNDVINSIVDSAVGTENVHHILEDVLPPEVYFRFNPEIDVMGIDEVRPGKLNEMIRCARAHIVRHADRFDELAVRLRPRLPQNLLERWRLEIFDEATLLMSVDEDRDGPLPGL